MDMPHPFIFPYLPGTAKVHEVNSQLHDKEDALNLLKYHLARAQERMKVQADKHRSDRQFAIGDLVYLKLQLFRQNTLAYRQLGSRKFEQL